MYDLIIVGGGAAGLSAAMYAQTKALAFLIIYEDPGGKASWGQLLAGQMSHEERPGSETVQHFLHVISNMPGRTMHDRVINILPIPSGFDVTTQRHANIQSKAIIIATGATPNPLLVRGASELLGQGLGYSLTSHARLIHDKVIAIIGNTPRALRGAAEASRVAQHVFLVTSDSIGFSTMAMSIRQQLNIEILEGYHVTEVVGEFAIQEIFLSHEHGTRAIGIDAAFVDLGMQANSASVANIVETDPDGFIQVNGSNATSLPGIFAAGDVTTRFGEHILIAIGDGARAAVSAYDYLLPRMIWQQREQAQEYDESDKYEAPGD